MYIPSEKKLSLAIQAEVKSQVSQSFKRGEAVIAMGDLNAVLNLKLDRLNANRLEKSEIPLLNWLNGNLCDTFNIAENLQYRKQQTRYT